MRIIGKMSGITVKEKNMKKNICSIIYFILILILPGIFTINGLGITTWQWWTLFLGMTTSYSLGIIIGSYMDDDTE